MDLIIIGREFEAFNTMFNVALKAGIFIRLLRHWNARYFPSLFLCSTFSFFNIRISKQTCKPRRSVSSGKVGKLPVVRRVYSEDTGASKNDLHLEDVFPVCHCDQHFHRLEKHGIIIRIKID